VSPVPAREATWAELLAHPEVTEHAELRSRFGLMAYHAGVEGGTFEVARDAAEAAGASLYAVTQPPLLRWHVASTLVDPSGSEMLGRFLDHVDVVVAVHGYGRLGRPRDILVGGGNRILAAHVSACLRTHAPGFSVIDDVEEIPRQLRGLHRANPVNRTAGGGVQLELPPAARGATPSPADAHLPCFPPAGIIAGVAEAARTWSGQPISNVPPERQ